MLLLPFVLIEATARIVPLLQVKRFNTLGAVDQPQFRGFNAGWDALDFERDDLDALLHALELLRHFRRRGRRWNAT